LYRTSQTHMTTAQSVAKAPKTRVERYVASLDDPIRRAESEKLLEMFARATDLPAAIWGTSKVGYGRYSYTLEGGFKSEFMMTGFEPKKRALTIYLSPDYEELVEQLERLGKHEKDKSCIRVRALQDIDMGVLEEMVKLGLASTERQYKTSET